MPVWTVFFASWAVTATIVIVFLLARQSEALQFPALGNPVTAEEQEALDQLWVTQSKVIDLETRLKHATQERDREKRDKEQIKREAAQDRLTVWRVRRALDGAGPTPEPAGRAISSEEHAKMILSGRTG